MMSSSSLLVLAGHSGMVHQQIKLKVRLTEQIKCVSVNVCQM